MSSTVTTNDVFSHVGGSYFEGSWIVVVVSVLTFIDFLWSKKLYLLIPELENVTFEDFSMISFWWHIVHGLCPSLGLQIFPFNCHCGIPLLLASQSFQKHTHHFCCATRLTRLVLTFISDEFQEFIVHINNRMVLLENGFWLIFKSYSQAVLPHFFQFWLYCHGLFSKYYSVVLSPHSCFCSCQIFRMEYEIKIEMLWK